MNFIKNCQRTNHESCIQKMMITKNLARNTISWIFLIKQNTLNRAIDCHDNHLAKHEIHREYHCWEFCRNFSKIKHASNARKTRDTTDSIEFKNSKTNANRASRTEILHSFNIQEMSSFHDYIQTSSCFQRKYAKRRKRTSLTRNKHLESMHQLQDIDIDEKIDILKSRTSRATDSDQII